MLTRISSKVMVKGSAAVVGEPKDERIDWRRWRLIRAGGHPEGDKPEGRSSTLLHLRLVLLPSIRDLRSPSTRPTQ
jgi:hypothetical protein